MRSAHATVLSIVALMSWAIWPTGAQAPTESLVSRFQNKLVRTPASYRARRRLEADNPRFRLSGWLDVLTEFDAGRLRYTVTARGGSELIQNKVLIAALETERELLREGRDPVALSDANYRLEDAEPDERGFARIRLLPLRRDKRLFDGHLLLTPDADLVQISGRLAKSPSFWTTSVTLTRRYGHLGGVRVPLSVTSVAEVRIAGRSTFSMTYEFELVDGLRVNGRELDTHGFAVSKSVCMVAPEDCQGSAVASATSSGPNGSFDPPANIQLEPTRSTVSAMMSPRRAAQLPRLG